PPCSTLFPYTTLFRSIFIISARRLVEQKHAAGAGGAADRLHQPQLVVARQVMDRQAAPRGVGMFGPAHHGVDEIAMVEIDLERRSVEHTSELQSRSDL